MLSYIHFLINYIFLFLGFLFYGEVELNIKAPDEAEAGSVFMVEVTIDKHNIGDFARLQQDFPPGYQVVAKNTYNGDLTFKDQKMKIIWLKFPADSVFTISYLVQVDPTADGVLDLGGTFSYVLENERKTVDLPVKRILIVPAGSTTNPNNLNANNNVDQNTSIADLNDPEKTLCYRQIMTEGNDYIVNILVKKGNMGQDKFAKIQEKIPAGFTAEYIDNKGSIFSFKDSNVKLIWMALPEEKQFVIKYKLTPDVPGTKPELSGSFSYLQNESTKVISILNVDFLNLPLIADVNNNNNTVVDTSQSNQNNQNNNSNNNNTVVENINNNNSNIDNNNQNNTDNTNNVKNNFTQPETGVYYKVQIAAAKQVSVNPKYYFRQFNISETVQLEMHDGWRKYTVGKFNEYKDARDHRVNIWQQTPIRDAFVAAYNNGTRITVQEALMIASQKWVL